MVSRLPEAIGSITDAIRLWERVGDVRGVAAAHDRGAIIEYYSARRREAEQHARLAVARDDTEAYGSACATQAYLAYRRHDHETADAGSRLAREVASRRGDDAVGLRCDIIEDASELLRGTLSARGRLLMHAAVALERSFDEVGTTAYSNLSAIDIEHRRFREAEGVLDRSIPITVRARHPRVQPVADGDAGAPALPAGPMGGGARGRRRRHRRSGHAAGDDVAASRAGAGGAQDRRGAGRGGPRPNTSMSHGASRSGSTSPWPTCPCCRRSPRGRG